jgi:hypothetical protein
VTGLDVTAYGATGDGVTDDSPAIQATLDAAVAGAPRAVVIPAGTYRLCSALLASGSVEIAGEGQERTVLLAPEAAPAIRVGSLTVSQPHGLHLHDFTIRGAASIGTPMVDIQQYGRKWVVERVNFDNGFGDRPGLRVWTSWVGTIRDCNFWKFGTEGQPSNRAAIVVKPQALGGGQGPINNILIDGCAFERVQAGIDLHDPNEVGTTTTIYSVEIRNPRFKNSATDGYMANSVGIRASNNNTFNVLVTSPFFEDFATGISVRGWGWIIDSPFGQSADVLIDLVVGGAHSIRGMVLQGSINNGIGTGVHCRTGISGACRLDLWKSVSGGTYLGDGWIDDTAGKLAVTAA